MGILAKHNPPLHRRRTADYAFSNVAGGFILCSGGTFPPRFWGSGDVDGAATVLAVSDIAKSLQHYRDVLGFDVTLQYGEPLYYVCLCRDEVSLHLIAANAAKRLPGNGAICIFVRDVDAIYVELTERGANVLKAPQDYAHGMRDFFDITDLDGNQITFGKESVAQDS